MRTLQLLGYVLAAILVLAVGTAIICAVFLIFAGLGAVGFVVSVVFFIAHSIRDYCEQPVSTRKDEGP